MPTTIRPDDVIDAYTEAELHGKLTVRLLTDEDPDSPRYVLIEGTVEALCYLAEVIQAQARYQADCGFQMGPYCFSPDATHRLSIHRTPCPH